MPPKKKKKTKKLAYAAPISVLLTPRQRAWVDEQCRAGDSVAAVVRRILQAAMDGRAS